MTGGAAFLVAGDVVNSLMEEGLFRGIIPIVKPLAKRLAMAHVRRWGAGA